VFWGAGVHASGITASLLFLPMVIAVVLAEAFRGALDSDLRIGGAALFIIAIKVAVLAAAHTKNHRPARRRRFHGASDRRRIRRRIASSTG